MPRYKFAWINLPPALTKGLATDLGLDGLNPVEALHAAYGARPDETLVLDAWDSLRQHWLARDREALAAVVEELWHKPRDGYRTPWTTSEQLEWLGKRNNSSRLREVVLARFVALGESPVAAGRSVGPPTSPKATATRAPVVEKIRRGRWHREWAGLGMDPHATAEDLCG